MATGQPIDPETLKRLEELNRELKRLTNGAQGVQDLVKFAGSFGEGMEGAVRATQELNQKLYDAKHVFSNISETLKNIVTDLKNPSGTKQILGAFEKLESIGRKLEDHRAGENILSVKQLKTLQQQAILKRTELKEGLELAKQQQATLDKNSKNYQEQYNKIQSYINEAVDALKEEEGLVNDLVAAGQKQIDNEKQLIKNIGITGQMFKGIQGILGKVGIEAEYFEGVMEKVRDGADPSKGGSRWKAFGAGISGVFGGISEALKDPLVQVTMLLGLTKKLFDIGFGYSKQIADIGKQYAVTADTARALADYNKDIAFSSDNVFVNQKSVAEATQQVNEAFGTTVILSKELVEGQVNLVHKLGLSAEEASNLTGYAAQYGKTQDQILANITKQNKGTLNNKKVIQEVLKTTGQLALFYKNQPELLAAAVVKAQKLGLTLEQTKNMTSKLLDFESSINAQMEAELMTGQSLNLNRARALALQGKTAEAAEEMLKQVGGINNFQNLNVIQQEALASAMGMSVDELSNSLIKQQKLNALTSVQKAEIAKLRAEGKGKLADDIEAGLVQGQSYETTKAQVDAQEKFAAAVDKMKEAFAALVSGPLGMMVDGLAKASGWVSSIFNFLGKIPGASQLGGAATAVVGGFALFKGVSGLLGRFFGGGKDKDKPTGSDDNPYTVKVKGGGAGGGGGIAEAVSGMLGGGGPAAAAPAGEGGGAADAAGGLLPGGGKKGGLFGGLKNMFKKGGGGIKGLFKGGLKKAGGGLFGKLFKGGIKGLLKKIPGVGLVTGGISAIGRLASGDWKGALGEVASGAASMVPGVGTAISTAIDLGMGASDAAAEGGGEGGGEAMAAPAAAPAISMPAPAPSGGGGGGILGGLLKGASMLAPLGIGGMLLSKMGGGSSDQVAELKRIADTVSKHTSILEAIKSKNLVVETDKLAYATAKATAQSYGNISNSNARIS